MTVSSLPVGDAADTFPLAHPGIDARLRMRRWDAPFARHPGNDLRGRSGVFLWRKTLTLSTVPASFLVHVTADQRYRLYVNGVSVSWGPARGDLQHWRFETVDLAPHLTAGENVVAAVVWWIGDDMAPMAQMTHEAAFLMQGNTEAETAVNTPAGWRVLRDDAYSFSTATADALRTYCVVGPGESFDASRHPWGWERPGFEDAAWPEAVRLGRGAAPYGLTDGEGHWWLVPREIPAMEETPVPFGRIVRAEGIAAPKKWPPSGGGALTVPANTRAVLLFDHGHETCAYPELSVSGGAGATVRLAYAEALFSPRDEGGGLFGIGERKGNRDETDGRILEGYADEWRPDGGETARLFRPLWWRTFRYAELTVETGDAPLTLHSLGAVYTGYPFADRSRFAAPGLPDADRLREIGWRTARLCAHETYMDCPYYEQLQYVGDTRIQCLVSLYTSGDHRLFRNALAQIDDSRITDGLTQSRFPSRIPQVIAPFSLWYVGMIHDYWMHVPGDDAFVRGLLPGVSGVLRWFRDRLRPDGLLGRLDWWCFVDWTGTDVGWHMGEPPGAKDDAGGSAIITLQYAIASREVGELFAAFGQDKEAARLYKEAEKAARAVRKLCYDAKKRRVADTPEGKTFSQHASILAVLADAIPAEKQRAVMERVLSDPELTQATFYFRFYLNRALVRAGMGDKWLDTLGPWRDMDALGLTTWAEKPEPTRSDCHAWSAAPNYEFLNTVLGVGSSGPGWRTVRIQPHLGDLTEVSGVVPHPRGGVSVSIKREGKSLEAEVRLPAGVPGVFVWRGESHHLGDDDRPVRLHLRA